MVNRLIRVASHIELAGFSIERSTTVIAVLKIVIISTSYWRAARLNRTTLQLV